MPGEQSIAGGVSPDAESLKHQCLENLLVMKKL